MTVWVVNDRLTAIPGARTMWHALLDLVPGSTFVPVDYGTGRVSQANPPGLVIRPASYFPSLRVPCPQIVFVQEIHDGGASLRAMLVDVALGAALVVFNSQYTKNHYPELADKESVVIPIGTDSDLFAPPDRDYGTSTLFVGAPSWVKGWPLLMEIVEAMPERRFSLVLKEQPPALPTNCTAFLSVPHAKLPDVIHGCSVAVCTSVVETQHLGGIEAGLCGVPIITPRLGAYADLDDGAWGTIVNDRDNISEWTQKIATPPNPGPFTRKFWIDNGYSLPSWRDAWTRAIAGVMAHA